MRIRALAFIVTALLALISTSAEARPKHHRSGGLCDGIHRCICGSTQTRYFGLPRIFNGHNLWQASAWPRAFPSTTPRVDAVMYQHGGGPTGHVSRIVRYAGGCTATVADERGQYERNICSRGARFVAVRGASTIEISAKPQRHTSHQPAAPPVLHGGPGSPDFS